MKYKIITLIAIVGFAFAGCGSSNKSEDGSLDSAQVDTSMSTPTTDTASMNNGQSDTSTTQSTTVPADSAR